MKAVYSIAHNSNQTAHHARSRSRGPHCRPKIDELSHPLCCIKAPQSRLNVPCLLAATFPLLFSPPTRARGLPELPPLLDTDGVQVPSARTLPGEWLTANIDPSAVYYARPCGCSNLQRPLALSRSADHRRLARTPPSHLIADLLCHSLTMRGVLTLYFRNSVLATRPNDENKSVAATRADGGGTTRTNGRKKNPTRTNDEALGPTEAMPHQLGA